MDFKIERLADLKAVLDNFEQYLSTNGYDTLK